MAARSYTCSVMSNEGGPGHAVSSVANALLLLKALQDNPSLAVKDGAALLKVAPSTAHRLLTTLQAYGFVVQDAASRRYLAGPALLDVALGVLRGIDVRRVARPYLESLSDEVRDTVSLIMLFDSEIRFIDSVEGPEAVRVSSRTGTILPAHCTAGGKVLLAHLPTSELTRLYPSEALPALTPRSIVNRDELLVELGAIRARGFATSFEQSTLGLSAVAVAVADPRGHAVASIAVSAPSARLEDHRVAGIVAAINRVVDRIQVDLRGPNAR